nr:uncharacterized protein LOC122273208 [Parasteatoda tepidariorum]
MVGMGVSIGTASCIMEKATFSHNQSKPTPSFNLSNCTNYDPTQARFIILSSTDKKLSTLSPFLVQKSLESLMGNPKIVRQLPSGDLLVETSSVKQTTALLKSHKLGNVTIRASPHNTLNISKGVISDKALQYLPISEIIEGLSTQGVIDARHITIKKGSEIIETQHIILTFSTATLPTDVKAGYRNCKVRPYIPNPLRCFKCQKFGHSTNNCRGKETCSRCVQTGHTFKSCTSPELCINCHESHSASSRLCQKWKQEKQILNIKVTQNLSYTEAKTKFLNSQPRPNISYAAAISNSKITKSIGIQYNEEETDPQNTKFKTLLPKKFVSTSTTKYSKAIQPTRSTSNSLPSQPSPQSSQQTPSQKNPSSNQYIKITPQLASVLHKKLSQSPMISKAKFVSKGRQNCFDKNRKKLINNKKDSQSDEMYTDEDGTDSEMQIEKGMETPVNLSPKNIKLKK